MAAWRSTIIFGGKRLVTPVEDLIKSLVIDRSNLFDWERGKVVKK